MRVRLLALCYIYVGTAGTAMQIFFENKKEVDRNMAEKNIFTILGSLSSEYTYQSYLMNSLNLNIQIRKKRLNILKTF